MLAVLVLILHTFKMLPTVFRVRVIILAALLTLRVIILAALDTLDARANPKHCTCATVKLHVATRTLVY